MKKILAFILVAIVSLSLIGCQTQEGTQGITDEFIIVGNTAATTGAFAGVGVPFNLAMQVVFDDYNANNEGRDIKFVHYDDGFVGSTGLTLTKKLVEEDKVFALVGHFGTNTVNATMDYLLETGIPMVYGVTGVNSLYFEDAPGNNILSVQPIYRTEGRMMVARTFHESLFGVAYDAKLGAEDNVVVLYSDDDAGQSIKLGIQDQVAAEGIATARVTYIPFSTLSASGAVQTALSQNPEAIILSANQAPATAAALALRQQGSTIPVVSSYVNAATTFTPAREQTAGGDTPDNALDDVYANLPYPIYANAWVDIAQASAPAPTAAQIGGDGTLAGWSLPFDYLAGFTAEYWEDYVALLNNSDRAEGDLTAKSLWANAYGMAGFVAAKAFVTILERVEDFDSLTWESFIELAESEPIDLPLAGTVDWSDGKRVGLDTLSLNKLVYAPSVSFAKIREVESLSVVTAK